MFERESEPHPTPLKNFLNYLVAWKGGGRPAATGGAAVAAAAPPTLTCGGRSGRPQRRGPYDYDFRLPWQRSRCAQWAGCLWGKRQSVCRNQTTTKREKNPKPLFNVKVVHGSERNQNGPPLDQNCWKLLAPRGSQLPPPKNSTKCGKTRIFTHFLKNRPKRSGKKMRQRKFFLVPRGPGPPWSGEGGWWSGPP